VPATRALLLSQGAIASAVLGHVQAERSMQLGLRDAAGIELDVTAPPPWSLIQRLAARPLPGLGRLDLDLHAVRWHAVEGLRGRAALVAALARQPFDVLLVHSHTLAFCAGSVMERVPTVLSLDTPAWQWHAMGVFRPARPYSHALLRPSRALERRALRRAARVVAWSQWAARAALAAAPDARVTVLAPGIDLARFRPADRRDGPIRLLFVGSRFEQKGGSDLLAAVGPLLGAKLEIDVVTPADVAPRAGLRTHRLRPNDPRLVDLYEQADVFCLPTYGDASPWSILEAMACATPVVSTACGAIPEMLDRGRAGRLVDAGDPSQLRAVIEALMADPGERRRLGQAARARVERGYDARDQGRKLGDLLREVTAQRRAAAAPIAPLPVTSQAS
jgi:alpha-maltose-1-phosphate synthase